MIRISLFGHFAVSADGRPLTSFESQKVRALLAYLAIEAERTHRRQTLAALFWPDEAKRTARHNLRQALYNLRATLNGNESGPLIMTTRTEAWFNPARTGVVDVHTFGKLLETGHQHRDNYLCGDCLRDLKAALDLYRGDLLEGFSLPDADRFDSWLRVHRQHLCERAVAALEQLARFHEQRREFEQACVYYRREIDLQPWREQAHAGLIRALALEGQTATALQRFELLRKILREEVDAEPSPETLRLIEQIKQGALRSQPPARGNPFKGLQPFAPEDADLFFGRENVVARMVELVEQGRFLALVGASGSGKSSLIRAGLLPRLQRQNGAAVQGSAWTAVYFRPGAHPFRALARALISGLALAQNRQEVVQALRQEGESLEPLLRSTARRPGSRLPDLLIVADQFEELFTQCEDAAERRHFIERLLALAEQTRSGGARVVLLLSLRAAFTGEAISYRALADKIQVGGVVLGPMSDEEMQRAITEPARMRGVLFEGGLVERLLADVAGNPGNLPLLQFALLRLWEQRSNGLLTHDAYEQIGGVAGALTLQAEDTYEKLSTEDQACARRVLLRMVQPGVNAPDTRRLIVRREVGEEDWRLIRMLADARLVVTDRDAAGQETAEIAHEALIRHWARLRSWLEADREFRSWQARLQAVLVQWEKSNEDPSALLRGVPLAEAEDWLSRRVNDLSARERAFIRAGVERREAELAEAEAQQQEALRRAQALAQAEHERAELAAKGRRRLRLLAFALGVTLLLFVIAAILAAQQAYRAADQASMAQLAQATAEAARDDASSQAQIALARQLAAQAQNEQMHRVDLSLLLGLESLRLSHSAADRKDLLLGLGVNPLLKTLLHGETAPIRNMTLSHDNPNLLITAAEGSTKLWDLQSKGMVKTLATHPHNDFARLSPDGSRMVVPDGNALLFWDAQTGEPLGAPRQDHPGDIDYMAFSYDGSRMISGSQDGTLILWDMAKVEPLRKYEYDGSGGMALNADGTRLAMFDDYADEGIGIEIWDLESGEMVSGPYFGHDGIIHVMKYSHDGRMLATAGFDGTARLWDGETGEPLAEPLRGHDGRVLSVAFSPDDSLLATGGTDGVINLWDLDTLEPLGEPLSGHGNWVWTLDFSDDGDILVSADADGDVLVWDVRAHRILRGHDARVRVAVASPAGDIVYSSGFDGRIVAWEAGTGQRLADFPTLHEGAITALAISPDGRVLASGSSSGRLILWDTAAREPLHPPIQAHGSVIISAAFSPDGHTLATGVFNGDIGLWDVASGRASGPFTPAHDGWVLSLAFSPDGNRLATGGTDAVIKLWEIHQDASGASLTPLGEPLGGHSNWVTSLLFTADGETLISASGDQTIRFWQVQTQQALGQPLLGHDTQVWRLLFYPPDGDGTLLSVDSNGMIIVWDRATREPKMPPIHTGIETEWIDIGADGNWLYEATFDETMHIWRMPDANWQVWACAVANRNLSEEEWRHYFGEYPYHATCGER